MAKKEPVILEIVNKKDAIIVVATRILDPKQTAKIPFVNYRQLEDAQAGERNNAITINTEITEEIIAKLKGESTEDPEGPTDPGDGETEEPEVPTDPEGPTDPGDGETEEPEVPTDPEVPEEPEPVVIESAEQIDGMTIAEMKKYIQVNEIDIPDYSNMKSAELKQALKVALGFAEETEEETEEGIDEGITE